MVKVNSVSQAELVIQNMIERIKQKKPGQEDQVVINTLNDVIKFLKQLSEKSKGPDKEKAENLYKIAIAAIEKA